MTIKPRCVAQVGSRGQCVLDTGHHAGHLPPEPSHAERETAARLIVAPTLPPEPPDRSVVLDVDGLAWQRKGNCWYAAGMVQGLVVVATNALSWTKLVFTGDLILIHEESEDG